MGGSELCLLGSICEVSDHRHHPSDVLAGFLLGALTAYWVVRECVGCGGLGGYSCFSNVIKKGRRVLERGRDGSLSPDRIIIA